MFMVISKFFHKTLGPKEKCLWDKWVFDLEILPRTLSEVNMEPIEGSNNTVYSLVQLNVIVSP